MGKNLKYAKSAAELAERYQVNRNSINTWIAAGAPRKKSGKFKLADWDNWVAKNKTKGTDDDSKTGLEKQRLREVLRKLKRENEIEEGKLIESDDVSLWAERLCSRIRAEMIRFKKTIGASLGVEAEKKAQAMVDAALKELEDNPLGAR